MITPVERIVASPGATNPVIRCVHRLTLRGIEALVVYFVPRVRARLGESTLIQSGFFDGKQSSQPIRLRCLLVKLSTQAWPEPGKSIQSTWCLRAWCPSFGPHSGPDGTGPDGTGLRRRLSSATGNAVWTSDNPARLLHRVTRAFPRGL